MNLEEEDPDKSNFETNKKSMRLITISSEGQDGLQLEAASTFMSEFVVMPMDSDSNDSDGSSTVVL